jgi:hypothetical protein
MSSDPNFGLLSIDALTYAFRSDGALDPGTKLLDVGLHGYTPIAALRTLADQPRHMSVALHELTHFLSLENTLGFLLSFLALRANWKSAALIHFCHTGKGIDQSTIHGYYLHQHNYRLLMEAWRPLLEGLAVYVQTHRADERGDALIAPLDLLLSWKVHVIALGEDPLSGRRPSGAQLDQLTGGFLAAAYRAIRDGPRLQVGDRPLAGCLELLDSKSLRPYFLGHAYLRAMQRCLARVNQEYESGEKFVGLIMRILRSSTKRLLKGNPRWDQPAGAERLYNWVEVVERAKPERIMALVEQDDNVDVLRFIETGEVSPGYSAAEIDIVRDLRELVPDEWKAFVRETSARDYDAIAAEQGDPPLALDHEELADSGTAAWLRGTTSLNLSMAGESNVGGWIPDGFRTKHAVALTVDDRLWWLAVSDADLARLGCAPAELPTLGLHAMRVGNACALPHTRCCIRIDCFASYVSPVKSGWSGRPTFLFELCNKKRVGDSVVASIAPATSNDRRCHLQVVADNQRELHSASMKFRRMVKNAASLRDLARAFEGRGIQPNGALLNSLTEEQDLAVSRVEEHVNRKILKALLGHVPAAETRAHLLSKGIGMFPEASELESTIVAAYGADAPIGDRRLDPLVDRINERSRRAIGKSVFKRSSRAGWASYCGLWGEAE